MKNHSQTLEQLNERGGLNPEQLYAVLQDQAYWTWSQQLKRYRVTEAGSKATGQKNGTMVGQKKMVELRDSFLDAQKTRVSTLVDQLTRGELTRRQWTLAMREAIKETYICQYALAMGGRQNLTASDFGRIGAMLKSQYQFLQRFEQDLKDGKYSGLNLESINRQIQVRAGMYIDSSVQSFEKGKAASYGLILPAYPGDGTSECKSNDRCAWVIEETDTEWLAYWQLRGGKHCRTCLGRAKEWNPLRIPRRLVVEVA